MIDFKKSNLFDRERVKYRTFLDKKLFTPEEYASRIQTSDQTINNFEVVDTTSFLGGSPIDFLGGSGEETDFSNLWGGDDSGLGGGDGERRRHVDISNERLHETGVWWKDILYAPFFLVIYVVKSLAYDFPTKDEWKSIMQAVQKVSLVTAAISVLLWILGFHFIFSLSFQAVAGGLMFGLAKSIHSVLDKDGEDKEGENNTSEDDGGSGFDIFGGDSDTAGSFDFSSLSVQDEALDLDGANLTLPSSSGGGFDFGSLLTTPMADQLSETVDTGKYKVLANSPIEIGSADDFARTLMDVYIANERYRGVEIPERKALIESLHGYVVTNDKAFGSWAVAQPRSNEYNNVAYALFKGLGQIQNTFLTDEEGMVVLSIKSNPLLYKIEVELPNYFKSSQIQSKIKEIEDALRDGESDTAVQVFVSYYQGIFVFKFMRLDSKNLISLGDILRFYDEEKGGTALDAYADPKLGLPILIGLQNNEYPYIVDLEANTSGVIIGGSGSGKSWVTFLVLINLVLTTDYNNVNFVVFDKKDAAFWNQFARFPHVLGYHTDYTQYLEQMRELYAEINRRKAFLKQIPVENLKGYRERLRTTGEYEKLKEVPNLVIIIDEITSTMQNMETYYLDRDEIQYYKEFRSLLSMITQEGRSLGVRLICIGQRAIDNSVPKNVIANSSFKFAMKMDAESDFEIMMGKEISNMPKPKSMGIGIIKTMGGDLQTIKTLTVGGANEDQILQLIRVLAFEWVRRADGKDDILNIPPALNLPKCYNRNKFVQMTLDEVEKWNILSPSEETPYKAGSSHNAGGAGEFNMMFNPHGAGAPTGGNTMDFMGMTQETPTDGTPFMSSFPTFEETLSLTNPWETPPAAFPIGQTEEDMKEDSFIGDEEDDMEDEEDFPVQFTDTTESIEDMPTSLFSFDSQSGTTQPFVMNNEHEDPLFMEVEAKNDTDLNHNPFYNELENTLPSNSSFETPAQEQVTEKVMSLEEFAKKIEEEPPKLSSVNLITTRIKVFGYILNFGEKVNEKGVAQSRIHQDVLLDKFSKEELVAAQSHTNILVEGNYYYAWRTSK